MKVGDIVVYHGVKYFVISTWINNPIIEIAPTKDGRGSFETHTDFVKAA